MVYTIVAIEGNHRIHYHHVVTNNDLEYVPSI